MQARITVVSVICFAIAACGGGGDDRPPGDTNSAPIFTSASDVQVEENSAGTFYTASASDADGDPLSFSIAGGADAALFEIDARGSLRFLAAPDFELPGDNDGDNIYEVSLQVTDGRNGRATQALRISVTDDPGGAFSVRRVGTGFLQPLFLTGLPDESGRVLIVQKGGLIRLLDPSDGTIAATPYADLSAFVDTQRERGLLGLALAPDYITSGVAYVFLTARDGALELRRLRANAARTAVSAGAGELLLQIEHPGTNHNGGWIAFGPDGYLYMSTGDGGGANDRDGNGQDPNTLLATILRLDVTRDAFPGNPDRNYGIPPDNPFASGGGAREVWHYGLRNPFRASFDRATGDLWIGDVGQNAREEINRAAVDTGGLNFGWPLFEGRMPLFGTDPTGLTAPVLDYPHEPGGFGGRSVTGGYVYRGPVEILQGLYVFADFINGNIWTVPIGDVPPGSSSAGAAVMRNRNADFTPDIGNLGNIASFGEDQEGNLYFVSLGGDVFRIVDES